MKMKDLVGTQPITNTEPMFSVSYEPEPPTYESVVIERMTADDRKRFFETGSNKYKVEFSYDKCPVGYAFRGGRIYPMFIIAADHIKEAEDKMFELLTKYYSDKKSIAVVEAKQLRHVEPVIVDDPDNIESFRNLVIPIYKCYQK